MQHSQPRWGSVHPAKDQISRPTRRTCPLHIIGPHERTSNVSSDVREGGSGRGATIRGWIGKTSVQHKGPADFVTEADFAAQEVVKTTVLQAFPQHSVLGEEDQLAGDTPSQTEYRWIVDPLDGTTNFVHGIPHYAVSLALEHRGQILVGAVFDPSLDECFTAALGQGAFLNGRPIHTSRATQLSEVIAGTGFPANLQPHSA